MEAGGWRPEEGRTRVPGFPRAAEEARAQGLADRVDGRDAGAGGRAVRRVGRALPPRLPRAVREGRGEVRRLRSGVPRVLSRPLAGARPGAAGDGLAR